MPDTQDYADWTFRLRFVRCGKAGCRCTNGVEHGPYWYGYRHVAGRTQSRYFGKRPASTFDTVRQAPPPVDPRWSYNGKMTFSAALRIFGLDKKPNAATLVSRWRALVFQHHPDHGGDTRVCAAINAAYSYLRS